MARSKKTSEPLVIESITHTDDKRRNIPTKEMEPVVRDDQAQPIPVAYPRNRDLDPQLVWRGKDEQDQHDLTVPTMPLYIQEKIHPKALIDDLARHKETPTQGRLFDDFGGLALDADKTEYYQHDQNWSNRMILGDSLQVMASLAEREGLRGKVQCIYFDPPYGIKFNSNFQWSTTSRDVKDGNVGHITREPEQVKAFRDTWRDGIHSYLTYLRDRLTVSRDLLTDSGSIFVQIGDENVHRVRAVMDEVFGDENFVAQINFITTSSSGSGVLDGVSDVILWYCKIIANVKYRQPLLRKGGVGGVIPSAYGKVELSDTTRRNATAEEKAGNFGAGVRLYALDNITSSRPVGDGDLREYTFQGKVFTPGKGTFKTDKIGLDRLYKQRRIDASESRIGYVRYLEDFSAIPLANLWTDTASSFMSDKVYVVQTNTKVIQRCLLMTTDPGDLVLDPTCGSGTTATVAEQWGRRWITIDTSRVALALARARIMGARYPFYLLADSREGQHKEGEVTRTAPSSRPVYGNIRHGFVYERVPHITLKSIANNSEIDVIWDKWQAKLEPLREKLNTAVKKTWQEWEIPREADPKWAEATAKLHADWWQARIGRQKEIDASIAAKAEFEFLYDKPYIDKKKVRVAGPFTVESLSPHRTLTLDENDELVDPLKPKKGLVPTGQDFASKMLEILKTSGVQQAHKEDKISFVTQIIWPGDRICAIGTYMEGETERKAGIFIGPEFGTVQRADLVAAAREAADAGFDLLIACAFNFEAHTTEFSKLGKLPVLKARMNADLHMAADLKNTGKGNLFVIFGEPDIDIQTGADGTVTVTIKGVDVFDPTSGEVRSDNPDNIACWFIDTDYDGESFFVRHAYFPGAGDPYKALKTTLKAEIDEEAWSSLTKTQSRPFPRPTSGRIAVKVINHLGDEVLKAYRV